MQFDPSQILATLNSYSGLIQAPIVLAALLYAAWQTRRLGKQIKLSMITPAAFHLKDVNQLMAEHPEFAEAIGGTSEGAFADSPSRHAVGEWLSVTMASMRLDGP